MMKFKLLHIIKLNNEKIYYFLFFGIMMFCGCNPCEPIPDKNPEQAIYLNVTTSNSQSIIITDESGEEMEMIADSAEIYSEPDKNGAFVFMRGGELYKAIPGKSPTLIKNDLLNQSEPAISPDGKYIAFKAEENELYIVGEDLTTLYNITSEMIQGFVPVFSPDSKYLAFYKGNANSRVLEVRQASDLFLEPIYSKAISGTDSLGKITWSTKGTLSFYTGKQNDYSLFVINPKNSENEEINITTFNVSFVHITPDGDSLAIRRSDDGKIFVRNIKGEPYYRRIDDGTGEFISKGEIKISEDGEYLIAIKKIGSIENLVSINLKTNKQSIITSNASRWFFGRKYEE